MLTFVSDGMFGSRSVVPWNSSPSGERTVTRYEISSRFDRSSYSLSSIRKCCVSSCVAVAHTCERRQRRADDSPETSS